MQYTLTQTNEHTRSFHTKNTLVHKKMQKESNNSSEDRYHRSESERARKRVRAAHTNFCREREKDARTHTNRDTGTDKHPPTHKRPHKSSQTHICALLTWI
jgi:hypothetical protein